MSTQREVDFLILLNYRKYCTKGFKGILVGLRCLGGGLVFVVFLDATKVWEKIASADVERCERQPRSDCIYQVPIDLE